MRGELDWIVMKALEKDRRRRYETANDFAADVMRYLTDQPVEACPPSAWYRFAKYTRRHRVSSGNGGYNSLFLDRQHCGEHMAGNPCHRRREAGDPQPRPGAASRQWTV